MMNDVDDLLDAAFDAYNRGDYALAEDRARSALILSPSHGDGFYLLGLIAHKKGIFTQACDLLNVAVKAYPNQSNYRLALAEVYQHHGDYDKALKIYEAFSDNPKVQLQLGWIALNQGKKTKAKKIFQKLLTGSTLAQAYRGLAFCFKDQKRLSYLKKAIAKDNNPIIAQDIARYYLSHKQPLKANKYLDFISDDVLKAKCLHALKKYQQAEKALMPYVQKNPYDKEALLLLATCYENLKEDSLSEKFYHQVITLDKKDYDAHKGLARLMMRQKKLSQALDHYQVLCRENPNDKETLLAMAMTLEGMGEESEALGLYFRLLTLKCRGLDIRIKTCIQKLSLKDKKLAKQFAKGWFKNYPKNKVAQKLAQVLGIILLLLFLGLPVRADYFSDDENWNLAWKNRMAAMGHAESQYELGEMFEKGQGVPKNISQAIHYYQLSAAQDYFPSILKLGEILAQENAYQDLEKSLQWYTYAAQKGEVQAQLYLADYYQNDNLDKEKAMYWLEKALKQLFPNATDLTQVSPDYKRLSE